MRSGRHSAFSDIVNIFERHIERTVMAAREFHWLLVAVEGDMTTSERRIHELRRAAEAITDLALTAMERHHGATALPNHSLLLIRHLHALLACIERAAERMSHAGAPPPHVFALATTLVRVTEEIQALLSSLHDAGRLNERSFACGRVRSLTHEAQQAMRTAPKHHEDVANWMMQALSECEAIAALIEREALAPPVATARAHAVMRH